MTLSLRREDLGAEDTMYKVKREDIGHKLKCVIRQGKTPASKKNDINIVTKQIVQRAVPTLASVTINVATTVHTRSIERLAYVRLLENIEGEIVKDPNIRGLETAGPVFIVCRFLRCIEKFDDYVTTGNPKLQMTHRATGPQRGNHGKSPVQFPRGKRQ